MDFCEQKEVSLTVSEANRRINNIFDQLGNKKRKSFILSIVYLKKEDIIHIILDLYFISVTNINIQYFSNYFSNGAFSTRVLYIN